MRGIIPTHLLMLIQPVLASLRLDNERMGSPWLLFPNIENIVPFSLTYLLLHL